jgi:PAS domain S-box-containing protein
MKEDFGMVCLKNSMAAGKQNSFLETLFESLHDAVLFVEADRIFTCNSKALDILGCSAKEELLGNALCQLSPPRQPDGQNSQEKILKESDNLTVGQTIKFEWQFLLRDGSRWDAEVHLRAFQFDGRRLTQAVVHDLTNQRALASERREGRKRLYGIIQSLPTPAFVIDKDHITVFWNKTLEQLSGIRAFEVLGTSNHWRAYHEIEGPCLADMLVDEAYGRISERYDGQCTPSEYIKGA